MEANEQHMHTHTEKNGSQIPANSVKNKIEKFAICDFRGCTAPLRRLLLSPPACAGSRCVTYVMIYVVRVQCAEPPHTHIRARDVCRRASAHVTQHSIRFERTNRMRVHKCVRECSCVCAALFDLNPNFIYVSHFQMKYVRRDSAPKHGNAVKFVFPHINRKIIAFASAGRKDGCVCGLRASARVALVDSVE